MNWWDIPKALFVFMISVACGFLTGIGIYAIIIKAKGTAVWIF